jgi:hypothetical protein
MNIIVPYNIDNVRFLNYINRDIEDKITTMALCNKLKQYFLNHLKCIHILGI